MTRSSHEKNFVQSYLEHWCLAGGGFPIFFADRSFDLDGNCMRVCECDGMKGDFPLPYIDFSLLTGVQAFK